MAQFKVTNQTLLHYWDQAIAMEGTLQALWNAGNLKRFSKFNSDRVMRIHQRQSELKHKYFVMVPVMDGEVHRVDRYERAMYVIKTEEVAQLSLAGEAPKQPKRVPVMQEGMDQKEFNKEWDALMSTEVTMEV